jgi:hypothetical protein
LQPHFVLIWYSAYVRQAPQVLAGQVLWPFSPLEPPSVIHLRSLLIRNLQGLSVPILCLLPLLLDCSSIILRFLRETGWTRGRLWGWHGEVSTESPFLEEGLYFYLGPICSIPWGDLPAMGPVAVLCNAG